MSTTTTKPFMRCGHQAQGTALIDGVEQPVCVICAGGERTLDARIIDSTRSFPDLLRDRVARCGCGREKPSSDALEGRLAFFEYLGPGSMDSRTRCAHCGYHAAGHRPSYSVRLRDGWGMRRERVVANSPEEAMAHAASNAERAAVQVELLDVAKIDDGRAIVNGCPGFEAGGEQDHDRYYCGCRGWD